MGYLQTIYNNKRYIVFIQTKNHQNILPENDISSKSLTELLKTIGSCSGGQFRSYKIYSKDITTIRIYEQNFINYKNNILEKSDFWKSLYQKYNFLTFILDLYLYNFVFMNEVKKFGNTITNAKPKYLIDKSDEALKILYGTRKEYPKDKAGKEIIEYIDFHNGSLIINDKIFKLDESIKSGYFLKILSQHFSDDYEYDGYYDIELSQFIDLYEKQSYIDGKDYNYLTLKGGNVKKSYIFTINYNILKEYNRKIIEMSGSVISMLNQ